MEIWKRIPGFNYEASSLGNLRHVKHQKNRSFSYRKGYARCTISSIEGISRPYLVHRLVYVAFYGEIPEDREIDHKNRIRNDNKIDNLRAVTRLENAANRDLEAASKNRIRAIVLLHEAGYSVDKIHEKLKSTP